MFQTFQPALHQCLTRHWTVVRYDGRGIGRSLRAVDDFSLDARLRDLDAVVAELGAERFAISASFLGLPAALTRTGVRPYHSRVCPVASNRPWPCSGNHRSPVALRTPSIKKYSP